MKTRHVWYSTNVDPTSPDAIHQILMFGTLQEIQSLKETVGEKVVKELFLNYPKKIYTAASLNFIKTFVLRISASIDEQQYLKSTPRYIR